MIFGQNYLTRRYELFPAYMDVTVTGLIDPMSQEIISQKELDRIVDEVVREVLGEFKGVYDKQTNYSLEAQKYLAMIGNKLPKNVYMKNVRIMYGSTKYDCKVRDYENQY